MVGTTIETDRLLLQIPRRDDGARLYAALAESAAYLDNWPIGFSGWQSSLSLPACDAWCTESQEKFAAGEAFRFLGCAKDDPDQVVSVLELCLDPHAAGMVELGYWVRQSAMKNGYASEGIAALAEWAPQRLGAGRWRCRIKGANRQYLLGLGFLESEDGTWMYRSTGPADEPPR
ncbi:GNAT family N-acetyltransferase [Devosia sp. A369]